MKKGIVIKSTGSWFTVKSEDDTIVNCKIKGTYRIKGIRATNPVAVGDRVEYKLQKSEKTGVIAHIEERKNYIIRRSPNLSREYQLIAVNVDQAWLMVTMTSPRTFPEFIDRFLVTAEAYSIPVNILFNKIDLYDETILSELHLLRKIYEDIGYPCYEISAKKKINIAPIQEKMTGKLNVISGNSGVGKSTLINLLDPSLKLRTEEISRSHKSGRHTTTFSEMHEFSFGGYIIDTPGIKGFGLIDFGKDELFHYFPEIFRISSRCRFHNCTHTHEPGCAVISAVQQGEISESRYISYINMLEDKGGKYR